MFTTYLAQRGGRLEDATNCWYAKCALLQDPENRKSTAEVLVIRAHPKLCSLLKIKKKVSECSKAFIFLFYLFLKKFSFKNLKNKKQYKEGQGFRAFCGESRVKCLTMRVQLQEAKKMLCRKSSSAILFDSAGDISSILLGY